MDVHTSTHIHASSFVSMQQEKDLALARVLLQGKRIEHPSRGWGVVRKIISTDIRGKPYVIQYDNGEVQIGLPIRD